MNETENAGHASSPARGRALALAEVGLVYVFIAAASGFLPRTFASWQVQHFGYRFISNLLLLFVVPFAVCAITRRPWSSLGLGLNGLGWHVRTGVKCGLLLLLLASWPFPILPLLRTTYQQWLGSGILAAANLTALVVIAWLLSRKPTPSVGQTSSREAAAFAGFVLLALALGALTFQLSRIGAGILFYLVFVGFGEEFLCRGYMQTRLNDAFGRPFSFFGIPWGPGLILTALLFGLMHPLVHNAHPWPWALWTAAGGLVFGVIREKSGGVVASGIAHGLFVLPSLFS